uniref:Mitochondrial inner membrane protease subunit 1 n=1 Tax=Tetraselmis sp. GSL018 TaxID=582737 RepID=A0A061RXL1_9CHLO|mmetsp:Transcript_33628/g.79819  ORF Transcript_33628/g.79819 Transcript_33628/m.79819 type:complete len:177 (+) Transcript_33628:156-686(+)
MGFWNQFKADWPLYRRVAIDILQYYCLVKSIQKYILDLEICVGPSMEPTFEKDGSLIVRENLTSRFCENKQGDVVVACNPLDVRHQICKRVIGLPGDSIFSPRKEQLTVVPPGHVWLQGDNLNNSRDSREYGPVPEALILGRVVYQVWPVKQLGAVKRQQQASDHSRWSGKWFGPT